MGGTGGVIIIVLIAAAIIGVRLYISKLSHDKLRASGSMVKRQGDFMRQVHVFTTTAPALKAVMGAMNLPALMNQNISWTPDYASGRVTFQKGGLAGTARSVLRTLDPAPDGRQVYAYNVVSWQERDFGASDQDVTGVNVLLTAIEKAFLAVDPATQVERQDASFKTKYNLF